MIEVTLRGVRGQMIYLNPHHIEYIETDGGTFIVLLSGKRLAVSEDYPTLYRRIIEYRKEIGVFRNEE